MSNRNVSLDNNLDTYHRGVRALMADLTRMANARWDPALDSTWRFLVDLQGQMIVLSDGGDRNLSVDLTDDAVQVFLKHPQLLRRPHPREPVPLYIPVDIRAHVVGSRLRFNRRSGVVERLLTVGSALAVEPERDDQWRYELREIAATGTRAGVVRFAVGILYAGIHSRVTWTASRAVTPLVAGLCWALRSNLRTWGSLSALLLWAGVETRNDTGLGAAILVVLSAFGALVWLVDTLRKRFDAHPPRHRNPSE
ncbi:hypothetical protein [Nonomuraea sp. SYSU D8015]|uniref:hypothetical protein n=1 Tax=Nonomuraea sp. SYSU D8015 TaxID=2593644 RepID=UPI0016604676|nr:hypothetical protein [Nonomuraea sp. SYSU D8015]